MDKLNEIFPTITLIGANTQTIELGAAYNELGATANDNVDGDISARIIINNSAVNTNVVGSYVVTYVVTDSNNHVTKITRIINVIDTIKPVITLNPPNPQIIELGIGYTELGATTDDGSLVTIDDSRFNDTVGVYPIIYSSTDTSNNKAQNKIRTVMVEDNQIPTITAPDNITIPTDAGINTASGVILGNPKTADNDRVKSVVNDAPLIFPLGNTIVIWTATDNSGNQATADQTITVEDKESPIITLLGDTPINVEWNSVYDDAGATANDNVDGDITGNIITIIPVDTGIGGQYTITYNIEDAAGNDAIQVTRIVNVAEPPPQPKVVKRGGGK